MGLFDGNKKEIARVKVIGVRTGEETKVLGTYNYGVYSFLVQYTDGTTDIIEKKLDDKTIRPLIGKIEW